ncbi:Arm DNA-binding domain-containing protein [Salinibacillus xinjiangensis]|uniref:AP2-like integrase N-terminal domain-containing protein n=1 Tax=Salinibacillus xinjiangensis TaxID=1229268 RepID=A0A6G1X6Z6_9BACI|nr:Arm DNA-binding domain-containing protein [Salinibacillus xinjiangensis]MRG86699.1 hypothetical protein [Salinibacillus xinjiangensis]
MASIRKRGQTWGYAVSHTVNGKTQQYTKSGFKTKKEAKLSAIESKLKQGKVPYFIKRSSNKKLLNIENSELVVKEVKKRINNESDYYLFLLGLTTGIRHGELVDLILQDFDFTIEKSQ